MQPWLKPAMTITSAADGADGRVSGVFCSKTYPCAGRTWFSQTPRMAMVWFHNLFFEKPTLQLKIRPLALPVPQDS